MSERIIFHNPEHKEHVGWTDNEGKPWDAPERIFGIVSELLSDNISTSEWIVVPEIYPELIDLVSSIHSSDMIAALLAASKSSGVNEPITTSFDRNPEDLSSAIYPGSFEQALMSAECAMLAADALLDNYDKTVIALTRPPGHHAGKNFYHGFCYINNAAVAAIELKSSGEKVAILDIDAHHGEGTQDIFYDDPNVLYVSLHANPDEVFPNSGYSSETGVGLAEGATLNLPFPVGVSEEEYVLLFRRALESIRQFGAGYVVISAGFDTHKDEYDNVPPITRLDDMSYKKLGHLISTLNIPRLIILEGGYNQKVLPTAFSSFIQGIDRVDNESIKMFTSSEELINEKGER